MVESSILLALAGPVGGENLLANYRALLPENSTQAERVNLIQAALESPAGDQLRAAIGQKIVERFVPVKFLVPERYAQWRAPVRDAMLFVVSHLSAPRLAPKLLEQLELPLSTPPQERLLRLIARVPGLQKLGQVLARNRHLRPSLRHALSRLENGIEDANADEIRSIIQKELGARLDDLKVEIETTMLSEASVSAVVRFTWWDAEAQCRRAGVFKVLKPHIPACFAEDMKILQGLAEHFGGDHPEYGFTSRVIPDTFTKVRRLLQHEVDFLGEQATLKQADELYRSMPKFRIPNLIEPLCTPNVTAITEEHGVKVTNAVGRMSKWRRGRVAEQLIEALVAVPLFADADDVIFHADPHAGNLLYNAHTGELILLDWALTERLSREQRRHLALFIVAVALRNHAGICREIGALAQHRIAPSSRRAGMVSGAVNGFLDALSPTHLPGAVDAMHLLEAVAVKGIRFPATLIMFSKSLFTLDGILHDIAGSEASMTLTLIVKLMLRYIMDGAFTLPLNSRDWIAIQLQAVLYPGRLLVQLEEGLMSRFLPSPGSPLMEPA